MLKTSIDYPFIVSILEKFEGKGLTDGYIPKDRSGNVLGNSGVTIGTGVDLGQQTQAGLISMGVPGYIVDKLAPYFGLRQNMAVEKLKALPLELSHDEIAALDAAVVKAYVNEVAARFDLQSRNDGAFASLHRNIQAVLVSLRYQLGFGGFPRTWRLILEGDIEAAANELDDSIKWGGKYTARRKAEAGLLRGACERPYSER